MATGGELPEEFASILRTPNAALLRNEKSLVFPSIQGARFLLEWRNRCVDFADPAEVPAVGTFPLLRMRTCPRMMGVLRPSGLRSARRR